MVDWWFVHFSGLFSYTCTNKSTLVIYRNLLFVLFINIRILDLNKTPTLAQGKVNPQDLRTEKKRHVQAISATSAAPKTLQGSSRNYMAAPSDLAELLIMVQDLPNDHPGTPHLMLLNSDRDRLLSYTSPFYEVSATARRGRGSAVPLHYAMVTTAPGDGAPAFLVWPLTKHGRVVEVWGAGEGSSFRNQNQASQCQTSMDLDSDVVSDGESDSYKPRNSRENSNFKAPLVNIDTLPDEIPVELQYPWSPVHQEEAPSHNTTCRGSSENLQDSAIKLPPMSLEEELRVREEAFHASFNFETQRCTAYARCRSCLAFCQARLPKWRSPSSQLPEECPPVLRNVEDDEARQARKKATHGPKSRSSEYRGVTFYKRTGRWEAHIWHRGAQAYLGASATKEGAARTYDKAALLLLGPEVDTNFPPEDYKIEIAYLYKLNKEQLGMYLRRDSRGLGAQVSYPGVRRVKNYYQALYGSKILGTFAIEEDAARAVYKEAARNPFDAMISLILDTHHVRSMPSYAAQRFAALDPDAVEGLQLRVQPSSNEFKRPIVLEGTSSPPRKKHSARPARKPSQDSTSPPASARAIAAPPLPVAAEQLAENKLHENIEESPSAHTIKHNWDAYLAPRTRHVNAASNNPFAPGARPSSSSCQAPRVPSVQGSTGEVSSSGFIKFKLFNVEISVEEPGQDHSSR